MPIKPMNIGEYDQIPDDEDVTPMGRSSSTSNTGRSYQCIGISVAVLLILAGIGYTSINFAANNSNTTIQLFQTSMGRNDVRLSLMTASNMVDLGLDIGSLSFGNTKCQLPLSSESNADCGLSKRPLSSLLVNSASKYQSIIGFGGAFTEATAINFNKIPTDVQKRVIDMYFGKNGIGLSLGRIHINSCDFSIESYSFDDIKDDFDLQYFDTEVTHDNAFIIPLILYAMEVAEDSGRPLRILASPWSPPAWMKKPVNGSKSSMLGSATPGGLKDDPRVKASWALYISKFITAYKRKGVPVWAITPQNEPEFPAPWEACAYNSTLERDFIGGYLGPTLDAHHPEVLILAYDHNKDHLLEWAETILGSDYKKYVDGMAFHWYGGDYRVTDGTYGYDAVNATHHFAPDKILLASEGCNCPGVNIDDWLRAERLAHDVMFDLQNYAQGWIDWNLLVDYTGGPNHLNNMCDAAVITTEDFSNIHVQPKYFYFGHISKYVPPGSVRISSSIVGDFSYDENIDPNVQGNIEVLMYQCEKSSRQMWRLNMDNRTIELITPSSDAWNHPNGDEFRTTRLCVAKGVDPKRGVLRLVDCTYSDPYTHFIAVELNAFSQIVDQASGLCVSMEEGVLEPGAVLKLATCKTPSDDEAPYAAAASQSFIFDGSTGEIRASANNAICMTAGWPFLNAVAFWDNVKKQTIVVISNEASVPTPIVLMDATLSKSHGQLGFMIDARSMETLVY